MIEVVKYIVTELVDDKEVVKVTQDANKIKVEVAKGDMGRIIGRQGRIAKAIRSVLKAISSKFDEKVTVDFEEAK